MDNNEMVVKLETRDGEVWASSQDVAEKILTRTTKMF